MVVKEITGVPGLRRDQKRSNVTQSSVGGSAGPPAESSPAPEVLPCPGCSSAAADPRTGLGCQPRLVGTASASAWSAALLQHKTRRHCQTHIRHKHVTLHHQHRHRSVLHHTHTNTQVGTIWNAPTFLNNTASLWYTMDNFGELCKYLTFTPLCSEDIFRFWCGAFAY